MLSAQDSAVGLEYLEWLWWKTLAAKAKLDDQAGDVSNKFRVNSRFKHNFRANQLSATWPSVSAVVIKFHTSGFLDSQNFNNVQTQFAGVSIEWSEDYKL